MIKRFLDFFIALLLLIFLFAPMLVLLILIRIKIGSPVLFRQVRPGLYGKPFLMIKLRTMSEQKGGDGALLSDELRLSSFGKFLRSTSLDELPELWNVLKGEMSLVGPRPLLTQYLPLYTSEQARRHDVRPGITGWAQINGRNAISWDEKFTLDLWYVENRSLILDIQILARTFISVFQAKDINAKGSATMPPFLGKDNK